MRQRSAFGEFSPRAPRRTRTGRLDFVNPFARHAVQGVADHCLDRREAPETHRNLVARCQRFDRPIALARPDKCAPRKAITATVAVIPVTAASVGLLTYATASIAIAVVAWLCRRLPVQSAGRHERTHQRGGFQRIAPCTIDLRFSIPLSQLRLCMTSRSLSAPSPPSHGTKSGIGGTPKEFTANRLSVTSERSQGPGPWATRWRCRARRDGIETPPGLGLGRRCAASLPPLGGDEKRSRNGVRLGKSFRTVVTGLCLSFQILEKLQSET